MSSIGTTLLDSLRSVERPGDFCVGGIRQILMPTIDVQGVGRIAFPILPVQAERLVAIAEAAPHGRGKETVVDREVRRTWQVDSAKVRIGGRHWDKTLAGLVADIALGLGVSEPIAADFHKLLVYDAGSFFVDHRDTEKARGMFATLVLVLPSTTHSGGELVIKHLGREVILDPRPEEPSEIGFAAFYADCIHEVRPVTKGCRLVLIYSLRFVGKGRALKAPDYRVEHGRVVELLRSWASAEEEPDKLILPLEHAYTPAELSFNALKGADAGVASVLVKAAAEADCDLHLALVSIEESGSAEHTGYYGRGRWSRDEEDEEFEVAEVLDMALILSEWRRPDGGEAGLGDFPFAEDELCPPDAFEDLLPDEQHFHEATGNEGASFERTYRRAGLVLWPTARRLAVLNQAGLRTTLPYLEDLTVRWETSNASVQSQLWREADELSRHMLRAWPRSPWREDDDDEAGRMLDLQIRLANVECIDAFLAEVSAEGHYAASDNGAIVRAAALLPVPRATELLVRVVRRNAAAHLSACGDLLLRCVAAPVGTTADLEQIGVALIDALPGDPTKREQVDAWTRPMRVKPGFVVDLLTATCRIDAGLAARALEHLLAWPKTYKPDDVLVPAALATAKLVESKARLAAGRLREAALDHLRRRIALPLKAPRDWTRTNTLKCTCGDCRGLGAFLTAPDQQQWRLKAVQDRRTHVEQSVRSAACDLDLTTERRGSPHTLVATKNQASYGRRARQRQQDLEHVSALGG
jgi:predicted 2-oxoglutarate/Fe(II)-dependent dioxygenase YbiX